MRMKYLVTAVLAAGCLNGAIAADKVTLKVSEIWGEDYPNTKALRYMSEQLAKKSNGRIELQVYSNGS
ncbi:MAG: hypothetical protein QM639_06585, partial [Rhodocyclaceae bacterium]